MDFRFRYAESRKEIDSLTDFVISQDLGYPSYFDWGMRMREELINDYKRAVVALSNGIIVGDAVFQPHKSFNRVREIKNFRVHPAVGDRYFGRFIIRQVEKTEPEKFDLIMCDARSNQKGIISFMESAGFVPVAQVRLYDEVPDIVMVKNTRKDGFPISSSMGQIVKAFSLPSNFGIDQGYMTRAE